jgi:phosphomannomutase
MKDPPIRFGTDGWRGIIGRDFTFANVRLVAQATADYFQTVEAGRAAILVGFDVRFLSAAFARATAEVFAGNGFETLLLDRVCPTPQISFEVRNRGLRGGIVITASHNPSEFNGFKVKSHYGGSATEEVTVQIEQRLGTSPVRQSDRIASVAPSDAWFGHLRSLVDWPAIERSGLVICADAMHGSGGTLLEALLRPTNCQVHSLRSRPDPLFGGISPEPMLPALEPLSAAVLAARADIGLATDGDADRLGVVAGDGRFVSTLEVLPLLLLHAYRNRGWRGAVVRSSIG